MARVILIQVVYNSRRFIPAVFPAMVGQTYKDIEIVAVICGNNDGSKELIARDFPQVKIIDPGENIGFAKAHNMVFAESNSEFFQLVNPDLVLSANYVEEMLKAFDDPKVGAATGKLLRYDFDRNQKTNIIDSTGVNIFKSGAARDRGQHEVDNGQYDKDVSIQAVSGAGCMYRRESLLKTSVHKSIDYSLKSIDLEFFDEDFHSYWEDVDLSWRMTNAGWLCKYQPTAVAWHGRGAGSNPGGYKKVFSFIKFHRQLPPKIRQLNYQNHILMYVKNSEKFYPQFIFRELVMFIYVLIFETSTLKIFPEFLKLLPMMWKKRQFIKSNIILGRE